MKTAKRNTLMERNKYVVEIVGEMCRRVGADPKIVGWRDDPNHDPQWYWKHTWSSEEQEAFVEWLTGYFRKNREAVIDLTGGRVSTKKYCRKLANEFVWNWGWKVK